ncbi:MAG: hypothetical protein QM765_27715 [Myxococcales bacterium]
MGLSACGGYGSSGTETIRNDSTAVGSDRDVGTEAGALMGSYQATEGTLLGLVLAKKDGKRVFVADQQVVCFKAPCLPAHLAGTWAAVDGTLRLTENANKHVYEYTLAGSKLTLKDPSTHRAVGAMTRVQSWCGESAHCELQTVSQPMANGGASEVVCRADQTCGIATGEVGLGDECGELPVCRRAALPGRRLRSLGWGCENLERGPPARRPFRWVEQRRRMGPLARPASRRATSSRHIRLLDGSSCGADSLARFRTEYPYSLRATA